MKPNAFVLMALAGLLGDGEPRKTWWEEKGINLEEEYELIKQKKSQLSRAERRAIVRMVESREPS